MRIAVAALGIAGVLAACAPTASSTACDPAAFRTVQRAAAAGSEVTLCGTVVRVSRVHRSRSGLHRVFVVDVGGNDRVPVDANVDIMGDFPIHLGQHAEVRGEYYVDGPGRDGVHWTHRTDRGTHPPGYVALDGVTYR